MCGDAFVWCLVQAVQGKGEVIKRWRVAGKELLGWERGTRNIYNYRKKK